MTAARRLPLAVLLLGTLLVALFGVRQAAGAGGNQVPVLEIGTDATDKGRLPAILTTPDIVTLGSRTPVVLIHGLGDTQKMWETLWDRTGRTATRSRFKFYCFSYDSRLAIDSNAQALKAQIDNYAGAGDELAGKEIIFVGYSMGGLVARGYIERYEGYRLTRRLITLATPHHGTPIADGAWMKDALGLVTFTWFVSLFNASSIHEGLTVFNGLRVPYSSVGVGNLRWDSSDGRPASDGFATSGSGYARTLSRYFNRSFAQRHYICYGAWQPSPRSGLPTSLDIMDEVLSNWGYHLAQDVSSAYAANDGVVPLSSALFLDTTGTGPISTITPRACGVDVALNEEQIELDQDGALPLARWFRGNHLSIFTDGAILGTLEHDLSLSTRDIEAEISWTADTSNPLRLVFDGQSSWSNHGSITDYSWLFGDEPGAVYSGREVPHTFSAPGTYDVTLQVSDRSGATAATTTQVSVPIDASQPPTYVSGILAGDNRWYAPGPYIVSGTLTVPAGSSLSIEPGTEVQFGHEPKNFDDGLEVYGRLSANGTTRHPIVFTSVDDTGNDPVPIGSWAGIRVGGTEGVVALQGCRIRCASWGVSGGGGVLTIANSSFEFCRTGLDAFKSQVGISGCTFRQCANNPATGDSGKGLLLWSCIAASVTGCSFADNGYAAWLHGTHAGTTFRGNTGSGGGVEGILLGGTFTGETTLDYNPGLPYVISSPWIDPDAALRFGPGSVIKFAPLTLWGGVISVSGELEFGGIPERPITLTSLADDSVDGDTNGDGSATEPEIPYNSDAYIRLIGPEASLALTGAVVRYANYGVSTGWHAGVRGVQVSNCTFEYVNRALEVETTHGVAISRSTFVGVPEHPMDIRLSGCDSATVTGCVFKGCGVSIWYGQDFAITANVFTGGHSPIILGGEIARPRITGNTASGNRTNAIRCLDMRFSADSTLACNPGLPWVFETHLWDSPPVPVGVTLTLGAGTVLKGKSEYGQYGGLACQGSLQALGTLESPVIFTSLRDDTAGGDTNGDGAASFPSPADWEGLHLLGTADAFVALDHCEMRYGGVRVMDSQALSASETEFRNAPVAIMLAEGQTQVSGCRFVQNDLAVHASGTNSTAAVTSCRFIRNTRAIVSEEKPLDATNNDWGDPSGPYDPSDDRTAGGWYNPDGTGDPVSDRVRYSPWAGGQIPPHEPSALFARTTSSSTVELDWADQSDDEEHFSIERKTSTDAYAEIGTTSANASHWTDVSAKPNLRYTYRVRAKGIGGYSAYSEQATCATLAAPGSLSAAALTQTTVELSWTDSSIGESEFRIERKSGGTDFQRVGGVGGGGTSYTDSGLMPNTDYTYRVRAHNGSGVSSYSNEADATTVPNAPAPPGDLHATSASAAEIDLAWTDNSDNETAFSIERKTGNGSFAQIATVAADVTAYASAGLRANTAYTYRVRAKNAGGSSDYTNEASATTLPNPPAAPDNLKATGVTQREVNPTWRDRSANEEGFKIERRPAEGEFAEIGRAGANATAYADTGLSPGTAYTYRVRAYNTGGDSAYSNEASATTPLDPPAAPSDLTATAISSTEIRLGWQDNSANEAGFKLERKTGAAEFAEVARPTAGVVEHFDTGLAAETAYSYRLRAYNTGGDSPYSAEAGATTLQAPCTLALTAPNGGETWRIGARKSITWTSEHAGGAVRIELSRDAGATWAELAASAPNTGGYTWTVTAPPSTAARVRLTSVDRPDCTDTTNADFTVAYGGTLAVDPPSLDFGRVKVGRTKTLTLTLRNTSAEETLSLTVAAPAAPFTLLSAPPAVLAAGKSAKLKLRFAPPKPVAYRKTLTVRSSDASRLRARVALTGTGMKK
jgi:pimeloyl-ACP methyl ester carboxylesterase